VAGGIGFSDNDMAAGLILFLGCLVAAFSTVWKRFVRNSPFQIAEACAGKLFS
jgi:hypothetical protein